MSEYTIKNLKEDVEDQAPNFGLSPDLEARFARDPLEMENAGISYQPVRVPKGTMRAFEAGEGLELIAFGAPNTGPGDAEPTQGWWS